MKAAVVIICLWVAAVSGAQDLTVPQHVPKLKEAFELKAARATLKRTQAELPRDNRYRKLVETKFKQANLVFDSWNSGAHPVYIATELHMKEGAAFFIEKAKYDDELKRFQADVAAYAATPITDENRSAMAAWRIRLFEWEKRGNEWGARINAEKTRLILRGDELLAQQSAVEAEWANELNAFTLYADAALKVGDIEEKLVAIEKQIKQDRMALERFKRQLPGFFDDVEGMAMQAESVRESGKSAAIGLGFSLAIDATILNKLAQEKVARNRIRDVKQTLIRGGIRPDHVKKILAGWEEGPNRVKTLVNERQLIESLSQIMDLAGVLDTASKGQYWEALAAALSMFVQSPVLKLIKTNAEVYAGLLHTGLAYGTAKARVNQFAKLADHQLKAVDSLTKVAIKHVRQKRELANERDTLISLYGF